MRTKYIIPIILISLFLATGVASAALWYPDDNDDLTPVDETWGIAIPALVSCDTIDTNASGTFACGADAGDISLWSTSTGFTYLDATTSDLVAGGNNTSSAFWIDVSTGKLYLGYGIASGTWEGIAIADAYIASSTEYLVDTDTTYSATGTLLDLTNEVFSINEGTLTTGKACIYTSGTGLVCNTTLTTGTVTSVAMSVPTGLSIAGSPITTAGTLALTLTAGYVIPLSASTTLWEATYASSSIFMEDEDINTFAELQAWVTDATLVKVATTTDTKYCVWASSTQQIACTEEGGSGYTNLTSFVDQTAWRVFYSDGSGDVTELALGSSGEYLKSTGASAAPEWATPSGDLFTDGGTFVYLASTTDDLVYGSDETSTASFLFDVSENDLFIGSGGAGDSVVDFYASGTHIWTIGMDDDDGDDFKIATSSDFATGVAIDIDLATLLVTVDDLTCTDCIDISGETNLTVGAIGIELSADDIALTSGYVIPLSASTTLWEVVYASSTNYEIMWASSTNWEATYASSSAYDIAYTERGSQIGDRSLTWDGSALDVDAEIFTESFSIPIRNATTSENGWIQHSLPNDITIIEISCFTNTSTIDIQLDERASSTPTVAGTDVMNSVLQCVTSTAATTSFANAGISAGAKINLDIDAVGTSGVDGAIHVHYTIDD